MASLILAMFLNSNQDVEKTLAKSDWLTTYHSQLRTNLTIICDSASSFIRPCSICVAVAIKPRRQYAMNDLLLCGLDLDRSLMMYHEALGQNYDPL